MGLYGILEGKKAQWADKLFLHQTQAFLSWVKEKINDGESVCVALSSLDVFILKEKKLEKAFNFLAQGIPRFVFCKKKSLESVLKECRLAKKEIEWQKIFSSQYIEVWENASSYQDKEIRPLRLGLSLEEKKELTVEVRRLLRCVLEGKEVKFSLTSPRFVQYQNLDVALWVNGRLRASVIECGKYLPVAFENAAERATRDERFKPLFLEELSEVEIEIAFMSDLEIPLLLEEYQKNDIDPTKGYSLSSFGKKGWYLPAVHNVFSFSSLQIMLEKMKWEKAGITEKVNVSQYSQFEVEEWKETAAGNVIDLLGPVIKKERSNEEGYEGVLEKSIHWLVQHQERDGNIPYIVTEDGIKKQYNAVVLGCTAHALACAGKYTKKQKAWESALRVYDFLNSPVHRRLFSHFPEKYLLAIAYFLRLSLVLDKAIDEKYVAVLIKNIDEMREDTILWLQTLSFLSEYRMKNNHFDPVLFSELEKAYSSFVDKKEFLETQLAHYPELLAIFSLLEKTTGEVKWEERRRRMTEWYAKQQGDDGSFPLAPGRLFSYTRGTGKIFEVISCFPRENKKVLERAFCYLSQNQYSEESLYWIPREKRQQLIGGFRHDAFNREAWADAAAHVILGCARILKDK